MKWALNPVLARESRVRMRGWKAPALIALYAGIMGLAVFLLLLLASYERVAFAPEVGGIINSFLVATQFALLVFAAPGLTAAAISGERERQTLDLLLVTRMTPLQITTGKLVAALAFTVLLMFASLPAYSVLFLLGGVSLKRLILTVIVYLTTVLLLGSIGLFFSTLFRRTQAAVVGSYGTSFALIVLPIILTVVVHDIFNGDLPSWTAYLAYINPAMGLGSGAGGPLADVLVLYHSVLDTPAAIDAVWWKYVLFALIGTGVFTGLATWRISPLKFKR